MSNCRFKKTDNERCCIAVNGECQFIECGYGEQCSIYNAFKSWTPPSPTPSTTVEYNNIVVEDDAEITVDTLYIIG